MKNCLMRTNSDYGKKSAICTFPHLTGYVISSIGVAVAMGVKVVIMAELLGANEGVGAKNCRCQSHVRYFNGHGLCAVGDCVCFPL